MGQRYQSSRQNSSQQPQDVLDADMMVCHLGLTGWIGFARPIKNSPPILAGRTELGRAAAGGAGRYTPGCGASCATWTHKTAPGQQES
jgi:hypothetical protein